MTEIPQTVTITLPEKYRQHAQTVWPAIAEVVRNDGYHWLADSIEEQVRPAVAEPTEFGSLVRAGRGGSDRVLWHPTTFHGKHYWMSETGVIEVWSELTDVEVLRVGLGESPSDSQKAAQDDPYMLGMKDAVYKVHGALQLLYAEAITSERKNAYEKAIQAVEELAP